MKRGRKSEEKFIRMVSTTIWQTKLCVVATMSNDFDSSLPLRKRWIGGLHADLPLLTLPVHDESEVLCDLDGLQQIAHQCNAGVSS